MIRILTPDGWSNFDGIRKTQNDRIDIGDIVCSPEHKIKIGNEFVLAKTLEHNEVGYGELYDAVEVKLGNQYYTNGIISHNCEFQGSSGTLISGAALKRMKAAAPVSSSNGISIYHPVEKNRSYVGLLDVSHGKGLDYSVCTIIDVTTVPYKLVAKYRGNTVTPRDFSTISANLGKYYNNAFLLVENNDIGAQVTYILWNEIEYENLFSSLNKGKAGKDLIYGITKKSDIGIRMTKNVKTLGCSVLKLLVEQGQFEITDADTISELNTFSKKGDSYAAEENKHDDCVMPLVSFAWMTTTTLFKEMTDVNVVNKMSDYIDDQLAMSILSAGVKIDGTEETTKKNVVRFGGEIWEEVDFNGYRGLSVF